MTSTLEDVLKKRVKQLFPRCIVQWNAGRIEVIYPNSWEFFIWKVTDVEWRITPWSLPEEFHPRLKELRMMIADTMRESGCDVLVNDTTTGDMIATGERSHTLMDIRRAFGSELTYDNRNDFLYQGHKVVCDTERGGWKLWFGYNHTVFLRDASLVQTCLESMSYEQAKAVIRQTTGGTWGREFGTDTIRFVDRLWGLSYEKVASDGQMDVTMELTPNVPGYPPLCSSGAEQDVLTELLHQLDDVKTRHRMRALLS